MFEHSIKVPRHFKVTANIFKKRTNALYALLTQTIKHAAKIDEIFENCSLFINEPRLDPWLAKVLTAELLYGKKALPGKSKPEQTILLYKDQFEKYISDHQDILKTQEIRRPRYVRINTNLLTTSDAIRAFQDEGYHFIRCTSGSYDDYLKQIQRLTEYDFTQDYHVKTLFVFAPGTKLHGHDLYLENKIILQAKATAMAVQLLAPPPGSIVLDMCAAPGMKTTQLAAYMRNEGKIYAVERNEKRYQTLCDFVERTRSTCVETLHKDSLEIKRGEYDDVEYILLDPSCSGSGMELSVHNYIEDTRLAKLTSLQEKFLKHAMNSFPNAKRIVYSTCSLFPEENERVITNIVKNSRAKWRVQEVKNLLKGQWNNFGSSLYGSMGAKCMYAKPDTDFTTGFFLAVLDRDHKEDKILKQVDEAELKVIDYQEVGQNSDGDIQRNVLKVSDMKKKKRKNNIDEFENKQEVIQEEHVVTKKKRQDEKEEMELRNGVGVEETNELTKEGGSEENEIREKTKKKDKNKELWNGVDVNEVNELTNEGGGKKKKNKNKELRNRDGVGEGNELIKEGGAKDNEIRKKKKKDKNKELRNGEGVNEVSELTNEGGAAENGICKKKRKNKYKELKCEVGVGEVDELTNERGAAENRIRKKKSKDKN